MMSRAKRFAGEDDFSKIKGSRARIDENFGSFREAFSEVS
jgi:hypothetical protein